jgi:hypothetical protein
MVRESGAPLAQRDTSFTSLSPLPIRALVVDQP